MTRLLKLTCIVRKEGKFYSAICPEIDVASQGRTPSEARKNLKEAVEGHLFVAREEGMLPELFRKARVTYLSVPLPAE
ncbi:type II toxin-antitoxin system HicB family antitoxin [Candidatus Woesearchaeota archaeon]|nr:type II toxin-antitoxin system HicB family antitoxin [Candidatus Woesearchaeota archaeon]